MRYKFAVPLALLLILGFTEPAIAVDVSITNPSAKQFRDYWYPHGAEISRYKLAQARYGEIHEGDAVLVFVTEDMNPELQVKADNPGPNDIPILKLNAMRHFYTGIYPYSTMISVFAAVDPQAHPLPLKISTSAQEWCGHVYMQLNLSGSTYAVESHSYFEKEADQRFDVPALISEDAVRTLIRIAPARLPVGDFEMLPSGLHVRLLHRPLLPRKVSASLDTTLQKSLEGNQLLVYTIDFVKGDRTVKIWFEKQFPHRIQAWEETQKGLSGKRLTTRAERTHTLMIAYWNHNRKVDRKFLKRLGLTPR